MHAVNDLVTMAPGKHLPSLIYICLPILFLPLCNFFPPSPETRGCAHTCDGSYCFSLETEILKTEGKSKEIRKQSKGKKRQMLVESLKFDSSYQ